MEPEAGLCCSSGAAGDAPRVKIALVYLLRIKTYYIAANGLRKMGRGALLLTTIRIRNFRTVADVTFNVSHKCALIGPNNVGKTNILYAVHLFFSLHPNTITNQIRRYVRSKDFPRSVESGRTTILLIFECEETPTDRELLTDYRGIKNLLGLPLAESSQSIIYNLTSDLTKFIRPFCYHRLSSKLQRRSRLFTRWSRTAFHLLILR
jgi:AAA ATPase domain